MSSEYYFMHDDMIIFNDIAYSEDNAYWNDPHSWERIPGFPDYLINVYAEIIRESDSYLVLTEISDDGQEIAHLVDALGVETCYVIENSADDDSSSEVSTEIMDDDDDDDDDIDALMREMVNDATPVVPAHEEYLTNYPIIITDGDGEFMQHFSSIRSMLQRMHGTEGWDPEVIYNTCNSPEWRKCYGKMIRWDPIIYLRHELNEKLRERREKM